MNGPENGQFSLRTAHFYLDPKVLKVLDFKIGRKSVVFLSLLVGFVYTFQTMTVSSCFPIASHRIIFASMEVIGSLANFGQISLTDKVKLDKNFDSAAWFCTLLNVFVILCFPIILIVTFKMNIKCIQRLDAPRAQESVFTIEFVVFKLAHSGIHEPGPAV